MVATPTIPITERRSRSAARGADSTRRSQPSTSSAPRVASTKSSGMVMNT
jgi:hypothetical protein